MKMVLPGSFFLRMAFMVLMRSSREPRGTSRLNRTGTSTSKSIRLVKTAAREVGHSMTTRGLELG